MQKNDIEWRVEGEWGRGRVEGEWGQTLGGRVGSNLEL